MTRIALACYALIASAMLLTGILLVQASDHLESKAHAEMVVNKGIYTVLTAKGITNEEYLYLLDNKNEKLLAYAQDSRGRIKLFGAIDIGDEFAKGLKAAGADDRR